MPDVGEASSRAGDVLPSPTTSVDLLEAVYRGDVGVIEGGEEMGLALEAGQALGVPGDLGRKG
jgi:hypothetical protein